MFFHPGDHLDKSLVLHRGQRPLGFISHGQVAHESDHVQIFQLFQDRENFIEQFHPEAQTAHPGIHLEVVVDGCFGVAGETIQPSGTIQVIDYGGQTIFQDVIFLARKGAAEHENRLLNTQPAQFDAFLDQSDTEHAGTGIGKDRSNPCDAMAVGIGLDHGQDITIVTDGIPDFPEIMPEGSEIDFSAGRSAGGHEQLRVNLLANQKAILNHVTLKSVKP